MEDERRHQGQVAVAEGEEGAYATALAAMEGLFLEQRARIAAELEAARAMAEGSDYGDDRRIARAAARAARVSWEADDQLAALKRRLDALYEERVSGPIMEVRQVSLKMEERNKRRFNRRISDRIR